MSQAGNVLRVEDLRVEIAGERGIAVAVKRLALTGRELPLASGLELERQAFGLLRDTEDRIEGRRTFAEARTPVFRGR